ncbi:MAG: hypothetical protein K5930_08025 [Treponemataceae bacterium]|nr:hypothetical protein [Treponemataceae bacterium]
MEEERNIIRYCVEDRYKQELMAMDSSKDDILRDVLPKVNLDFFRKAYKVV